MGQHRSRCSQATGGTMPFQTEENHCTALHVTMHMQKFPPRRSPKVEGIWSKGPWSVAFQMKLTCIRTYTVYILEFHAWLLCRHLFCLQALAAGIQIVTVCNAINTGSHLVNCIQNVYDSRHRYGRTQCSTESIAQISWHPIIGTLLYNTARKLILISINSSIYLCAIDVHIFASLLVGDSHSVHSATLAGPASFQI